jgi:hypothetical protein
MGQLECDPQLARQGAAAILCVAATAAAMPWIADRGVEQRQHAQYIAKAASMQALLQAEPAERGTEGLVQLASFNAGSGFQAQGEALLSNAALRRNALTIASRVRDAFSLTPIDPVQPDFMKQAMRSLREQNCLAQAVYYEARGETYQGQLAVAEVVRNRVKSRHWPNTYCGVVFEGSTRSTGCQFTFTCDGSIKARPRGPAWRQAQSIAAEVYGGLNRPITGLATHYHTTAVDPYWNDSLVETGRIGSHIFYRLPSRRERQDIQADNTLRGRYQPPAPVVAAAPEPTEIAPVVAPAAITDIAT